MPPILVYVFSVPPFFSLLHLECVEGPVLCHVDARAPPVWDKGAMFSVFFSEPLPHTRTKGEREGEKEREGERGRARGYFNSLHRQQTGVWFPRQVSTGMNSYQPRGQQHSEQKNTNGSVRRSPMPLTVRIPGKCFSFSIVEDGRKICILLASKKAGLSVDKFHISHAKVKLFWCIVPFLFTIGVIKFVCGAVGNIGRCTALEGLFVRICEANFTLLKAIDIYFVLVL